VIEFMVLRVAGGGQGNNAPEGTSRNDWCWRTDPGRNQGRSVTRSALQPATTFDLHCRTEPNGFALPLQANSLVGGSSAEPLLASLVRGDDENATTRDSAFAAGLAPRFGAQCPDFVGLALARGSPKPAVSLAVSLSAAGGFANGCSP